MYQRREKKRKILSQSRFVIFFLPLFSISQGGRMLIIFLTLNNPSALLSEVAENDLMHFPTDVSLQRLVHLVHQSSFPGEKFGERSALAPYMFYEGRELTLLKTNGTHSHSADSRGWENGVVCRCVCAERENCLCISVCAANICTLSASPLLVWRYLLMHCWPI